MNVRSLVASGVLVLGVVLPASAAMASDDPYTSTPPSSVLDTKIERAPEVLPAVQTRQTLPVTGSDLVGLTAIGLLAIGTGTVLVRRSRLQPAAATATAEA
jgi:LPXTG-motif cell wall-anchored protein